MIDGRIVLLLSIAYVGALFLVAWLGDRWLRERTDPGGRPLIYALSLAVYCTSWTFFGSVGLSARTGYDFVPVYLGPILVFLLGWRFVLRIVRLAKSQNITSIADFLAARYGKSPSVAAVVTLLAVIGTLPYIALQLKAIAISVEVLLGPSPFRDLELARGAPIDTAFIVALALALFAVLFGTRHIDATEHQNGLMVAIAAESLVKLAAFIAVGVFVTFGLLGGIGGLVSKARQSSEVMAIFAQGLNGGAWLTVLLLSSLCIILLPRQFHVTVVENNTENEVRRARWLFPLYLVLINLFVVPIAMGGLMLLGSGPVERDMLVLLLPLSAGADTLALFAFLGGLSAATAMVIVDSVALAIMICNGLVVPLLLRNRLRTEVPGEDLSERLLFVRRISILAILLLGYLVYRALGHVHGLATIGLVSFAAIAQLGPAFIGALLWRRGTARGAIAGIVAGLGVWSYTLLLPWVVKSGWLSQDLLTLGPLGIGLLRPEALFYLQFDPLTHGVLWSLSANLLAYILVSLLRLPEPIERLQASLFVADDLTRTTAPAPAFRLWRTSVTVGDLQQTVARYLGAERAERSFREFELSRNQARTPSAEADLATVRFSERLLASAIGAASARLVLALLLRRGTVTGQSALRLLDDASDALQYNRDLLQSALDQVRHGLSVFDRDMRLVCWNRQFRELLELPADFGRVGVPLDHILRHMAGQGSFGPGMGEAKVAELSVRIGVPQEAFQLHLASSDRILEVRTSPMPQGGIVTTYSDITDRARASEMLERRVTDRTAELTRLNAALEVAKASADAASQDKTRFLAAASHDILQPLNAARLYASSLVEQGGKSGETALARNIDASLGAVEEIISTLIDISRLDAGRLEPEITRFPLVELLDQLAVEFSLLARERGLALRIARTSRWVETDRRMLRRVLRNFIANALKYTRRGGVLIGARRRGGRVIIQVVDTGPGIAPADQGHVFKEFHRLPETAADVRGLGLGLSIVERIGRILEAPIGLASRPGHGSIFSISVPGTVAQVLPADVEPASLQPTGATLGRLVGCRVIAIDNEPDVLAGMKSLLEGWHCVVETAQGIEDAREIARRSAPAPDIILADYHLTRGNGLEAIDVVRAALGATPPAVVITADPTGEVEREVRLRGHALLRKPVKAAALRAVMTQLTLRRAVAAE